MRERTPWTPGPWQVEHNVWREQMVAAEGQAVCFPLQDGDAHLIAAAPDLYEALMQAWEVLDHLAPNHPATELASELLDRVAGSATHQEEEVSDAS